MSGPSLHILNRQLLTFLTKTKQKQKSPTMRSEIAPLVSNDISLVRLPIDVDMNASCVSAEPYWRSAQGVPHPKVAEMGSWWYLGPG